MPRVKITPVTAVYGETALRIPLERLEEHWRQSGRPFTHLLDALFTHHFAGITRFYSPLTEEGRERSDLGYLCIENDRPWRTHQIQRRVVVQSATDAGVMLQSLRWLVRETGVAVELWQGKGTATCRALAFGELQSVTAPTLPQAVTLAALLVKGVDVAHLQALAPARSSGTDEAK
jgi:hypothetical protein